MLPNFHTVAVPADVLRSIAVLGLAIFVVGCATETKPIPQVVVVTTPGVPGANCSLSSSSFDSILVVTPETVPLQLGRANISVRCSKECYQDGAGVIASKLEGVVSGNIILGRMAGSGADATGSAFNNTPEIQIAMTRMPRCQTG